MPKKKMVKRKKLARASKPASKPVSDTPRNPASVSWKGLEFYRNEHGWGWYFGAILVFIGLELVSIFIVRDVVLSVSILAAAAILIYHLTLKPRTLQFKIDSNGVQVGATTFRANQLKPFWFTYEPDALLHLEIKGRWLPLSIPVGKLENQVRTALNIFLTEQQDKEEDLFSLLIRLLKL